MSPPPWEGQELGFLQLATFSMGTRFPSHRNERLMEGWDGHPTLAQGSACQTGLNRALGFRRGTLEMPLAKDHLAG